MINKNNKRCGIAPAIGVAGDKQRTADQGWRHLACVDPIERDFDPVIVHHDSDRDLPASRPAAQTRAEFERVGDASIDYQAWASATQSEGGSSADHRFNRPGHQCCCLII